MLPAKKTIRLLPWILAASLALVTLPAHANTCEDLIKLRLPHGSVTRAELITSGTFTPLTGTPHTGLPAFCRVTATLKPSPDSDIRIEVWMPASHWNQRFEGTGNGGFAGNISYGPLADGLRHGYAVANTDMGMATPPGDTAAIFIHRPERWKDWGYRSTHEMTVAGKQIVHAFYDHDPKRAYFYGCSTGGEQALSEAQRFPDDYDGIAGGAPAQNRTGVHVSILWNFAVNEKSPASYLDGPARTLLSHAVMNACDTLDGVKDGIINDPTQCHFDPASLACTTTGQENCLSPAQVQTAQALYSGPSNPRTGQSLYPGLPRGSEFGWEGLDPKAGGPAPFVAIFQWVLGKDFDWRTFDYDHQYERYTNTLAPMVNATNPDLDAFRKHGHKFLLYQGWSDWLVAPGETIHSSDTVVTRGNAPGASLPPLNDNLRLFMIPGMAHCGNGPGATQFDALATVVDWVETGVAPERIVASRQAQGEGDNSTLERPLCPYPRTAKYSGTGSVNNAASFVCTDPQH